MNSNMKIFQDR